MTWVETGLGIWTGAATVMLVPLRTIPKLNGDETGLDPLPTDISQA
jgi:hypothetical protein